MNTAISRATSSPGAARPQDGRHVEAVRALIVARRGAAGERTLPAAYPNGRALTNDVFSARMASWPTERPAPAASDRTTASWPEFVFLGPPGP